MNKYNIKQGEVAVFYGKTGSGITTCLFDALQEVHQPDDAVVLIDVEGGCGRQVRACWDRGKDKLTTVNAHSGEGVLRTLGELKKIIRQFPENRLRTLAIDGITSIHVPERIAGAALVVMEVVKFARAHGLTLLMSGHARKDFGSKPREIHGYEPSPNSYFLDRRFWVEDGKATEEPVTRLESKDPWAWGQS